MLSDVTKPIVPGNSRIRDCERWIRENGFVVIPSSWDSAFVTKALQQKLGSAGDVRDVKQKSLDSSGEFTHIHTLVVDWKGVVLDGRA
jgi:hypothetical protein